MKYSLYLLRASRKAFEANIEWTDSHHMLSSAEIINYFWFHLQMQRVLCDQIEKAKGANALVTSDAIQKEVQAFYEDIKVIHQEETMESPMFEL